MNSLTKLFFTTDFIYAVFRGMTPLLFAGMGAVLSDIAGVPNISLEGLMLIAAFSGMYFSYLTQSALLGLLAALIISMLFSGLLALFTLYFKTNIILGGIAVNSLASGGTVFLLYLLTGDKGTSISLQSKTLPAVNIPLIQNIPIVGAILSGHNVLTYLSLLSVLFTFILLQRTAFGLHLRCVGEKKEAARSVGIRAEKTQAAALLLSGLMCGFGGAFMSMGYVSWFSRDMLASRGWVALAAEAMGMQTPLGTALTCGLFGMADAFANAVGTLGFSSDLVNTIPYVATLLGLSIFSVRAFKRKRRAEGWTS